MTRDLGSGRYATGNSHDERIETIDRDLKTDRNRQSRNEIVVIILTFNQREMTLKCLAEISRINHPSFRVLLWDNGSSDGTAQAVEAEFPSVLYHQQDNNLGVARGRNRAADLAIRRFTPSYLLFLDNDMLIEPGFISALHEPFIDDETIGQTQAKLRFLDDPDRLNDGGGCQIEFWRGRTVPVGFNELDRGQYDTQRECVACGGAMMVRTDVFQELNGFDEAFNPFGPEDLDFSLRLKRAGYRSLFVPQAVAYHAVSHTVGADFEPEYAFDKSRHWFRFMQRHAPIHQRALFWAVGAPYLALRAGLREAMRGNFKAFFALLRGGLRKTPAD